MHVWSVPRQNTSPNHDEAEKRISPDHGSLAVTVDKWAGLKGCGVFKRGTIGQCDSIFSQSCPWQVYSVNIFLFLVNTVWINVDKHKIICRIQRFFSTSALISEFLNRRLPLSSVTQIIDNHCYGKYQPNLYLKSVMTHWCSCCPLQSKPKHRFSIWSFPQPARKDFLFESQTQNYSVVVQSIHFDSVIKCSAQRLYVFFFFCFCWSCFVWLIVVSSLFLFLCHSSEALQSTLWFISILYY